MKNNLLKSAILSALLVPSINKTNFAKEGMWPPSQLKRQETEMQKLGLNIPVDQLFSSDGKGLNNAVVIFGKGCTGEVVSKEGLLFTNHHCAYGTAQQLSTAGRNLLTDGYWAMNKQQELPCPGLTVTFIRNIEDVTKYILKDLSDTLNETARNTKINERISELKRAYKNTQGVDVDIKPYYTGNQYWASVTETFSDVRLVGFPPNGIGKFGADTDNWMWPRQTGDFAVFRVYANKDNKPADYDVANLPYKPKVYFPISTKGIKEDDFTMVYGFPYTTQEYISSYQLNQIQHISDPIRIEAREVRLGIWDEAMSKNPDIFLKYAAKQSSVSNGYKKMKGEVLGLTTNDVVGKKQAFEYKFQEAVNQVDNLPEDKLLLNKMQATVSSAENALMAQEYASETVLAIEVIQQSAWLNKIMQVYRSTLTQQEKADSLQKFKKSIAAFYKNYDVATDKKVFLGLMPLYMKQDNQIVAPGMKKLLYNAGNNYNSWANSIYNNSMALSASDMEALLDAASASDSTKIKQDPAFQIYETIYTHLTQKVIPELKKYNERITPMNRRYMNRQLAYFSGQKDFYPDANQTLRLTYGQVKSVNIPGSNIFQTTLNDKIKRHNSEVDEFNIPQKLRALYESKNYGKWSENGTVPINFVATNHTSGGNSGSPVLNGKGELIGINFDRIWQGTMSDLYYDPTVCRNVTVDVRYVLFVIEKFGNAGWLFSEMKFADK